MRRYHSSKNENAGSPSTVVYNNVQQMIVNMRNQQVLIDADISKQHGIETGRINETVRNNPDKFPADYMFALATDELSDLRSRFSFAKVSPKSWTQPKAFTEKGSYMLATVLKSRRATEDTFAINKYGSALSEKVFPDPCHRDWPLGS